MEINLRIDYVKSKTPHLNDWWKYTNIVEDLITDCIDSNVLNLKYFSDYNRYMDINDLEQSPKLYRNLLKPNSKWGNGFYLTTEKNTDSNFVEFHLQEDSISMNLRSEFNHKGDQINSLKQIVLNLYSKYRKEIILGPSVQISFPRTEFTKYRPPLDYAGLGEWAIINFIQPEYYNFYPNAVIEGYENLLTENLPKGVTLEKRDQFFTVIWGDKISSEEQLREILMSREEFIYKHTTLALAHGYNIEGDQNIFNISALDKCSKNESFFNYYNEDNGMAFKLLVLGTKMQFAPDDKSKIDFYLKTKKTDSNQPINDIVLILPSRRTAASIEKTAKESGVYKVLYLDNHVDVWSMEPVGNWRN